MSKSKHWSLLALFIKQVHRVSHFISDQSSKEKNINDLIQALLLRSPYYVNMLNLVIPQDLVFVFGNYVESFGTNNAGTSVTGTPFAPQIAEQHEAGIKTEFFDKRMTYINETNTVSASSAVYKAYTTVDLGISKSIIKDVTARMTFMNVGNVKYDGIGYIAPGATIMGGIVAKF